MMNLDKANDLAHDWLYAAEGYTKFFNNHKEFLRLLISIIDYGPSHLSLIALFNLYRDNELALYNSCSTRFTNNNVKVLGSFLADLLYDVEDDGELYLIEFSSSILSACYKITREDPREYKPIVVNNLVRLGYSKVKVTGFTRIDRIGNCEDKVSLYKILSFLEDKKDLKVLIENR